MNTRQHGPDTVWSYIDAIDNIPPAVFRYCDDRVCIRPCIINELFETVFENCAAITSVALSDSSFGPVVDVCWRDVLFPEPKTTGMIMPNAMIQATINRYFLLTIKPPSLAKIERLL